MEERAFVKLKILGEPMGKQRPRFSNVNGFPKSYTPKETINYESRVVSEYKQNYSGMAFDYNDEIMATIIANFKIPKAHYKYHKKTGTTDLDKEGQLMLKGIKRPTINKDIDNICKICMDALNGIAYPDDKQIVSLVGLKYYSEEPSVEITLERRKNYYEW